MECEMGYIKVARITLNSCANLLLPFDKNYVNIMIKSNGIYLLPSNEGLKLFHRERGGRMFDIDRRRSDIMRALYLNGLSTHEPFFSLKEADGLLMLEHSSAKNMPKRISCVKVWPLEPPVPPAFMIPKIENYLGSFSIRARYVNDNYNNVTFSVANSN